MRSRPHKFIWFCESSVFDYNKLNNTNAVYNNLSYNNDLLYFNLELEFNYIYSKVQINKSVVSGILLDGGEILLGYLLETAAGERRRVVSDVFLYLNRKKKLVLLTMPIARNVLS